MAKPFKYRGRERTVEDVTKDSKASSGAFDSYMVQGVAFYKAREGENTIRMLPLSWEDTKKWGLGWYIFIDVHYSVGPDESAYLCREKMLGEHCPICAAKDGLDKEEADKLKPNRRALCWVIDRDNEKAGPQAWSMPLKLFREISTRSVNKRDNTPKYIDDPEEGMDVSFVREGTGKHTDYGTVEIAAPSALSDNEKRAARWLEAIQAQPLPDILNFYDDDYLEKVLKGKSKRKARDDDDDDDEDEDKPKAKKGKRPVADDDDDEDEDDTKPVKSKRKPSKADDDDDEPDSEDEDDDKPAPKKKPGKKASDDDDEDADAESDDDDAGDSDDEDDEPKASTKRRPTRKASDDDDDEDEADAESDDADEDEEDEPAPKKGKSATSRAKERLANLKAKKGRR